MNEDFTPVTTVRTNWTPWILGILLAIISCCCLLGIVTVAYTFWPTAEAAAQPAAEAATQPEIVSSAPEYAPDSTGVTSCNGWDTSPGATNTLLPGQTVRGDVVINGKAYYDNGVGEGTSGINMTSDGLEVYSQWGSGCEDTTDIYYLVEKDLTNGCGSECDVARIVIFTDNGISQKFHTEP
jgi:hypothetical protein